MDYMGRGATVQGAVGAGSAAVFGAATVWIVLAVLLLALGVAMILVSMRRNHQDAVAAGVVPRTKRDNLFKR